MLNRPVTQEPNSNEPAKKSWTSMLPDVKSHMTTKNLLVAGASVAALAGSALAYYSLFKNRPSAQPVANVLKPTTFKR